VVRNSLSKVRASVIKANSAAKQVNLTTNVVMDRFEPKTTKALQNPAAAVAEDHQKGFEAGYAEGLAKAQADVIAATEETTKRVRRVVSALTEAVDTFDQRQTVALADVEDAIVAGAFALARTILQRELICAEDPGGDALARALQLVPDRGEVVARMHPDDAATLNMQRLQSATRQIVLVADPNVERGGCIIEAGEMRIDAQLSTALAQAGKAMKVDPALVDTKEPVAGEDVVQARMAAAAEALAQAAGSLPQRAE
jgi:flagellar assembly protein FliH